MMRSLTIGLMAGVATASEVACDAGAESCHAQDLAASSMIQFKTHKASINKKEQVAMAKHGESKVFTGTPRNIQPITKGITYVQLDHNKYKQAKLQQALKKKDAGTLSEHASSVLDEALKKAKAIEDKEGDHVDPNMDEFDRKSHEHDTIAKALKDEDTDSLLETGLEDHAAILRALEALSGSMSVEDATIVPTLSDLEEIFGLPDTPMVHAGAVQGDMVPEDDTSETKLLLMQAAKSGARWGGQLWEDKRSIPYCFANDIAESSKTAAIDAIQYFRNVIPCLGFREVGVGSDGDKKCAEQPGIFIMSRDSGCYANVGQPHMWQGKYMGSVMNLQPDGCDTLGIAAHELGHNLGMLHEQARTDSHNYVTIFWDNIRPSSVSQYNIEDKVDTSIPYDIMSLMHYGDTDFAKRNADGSKMKTMEAVDGTTSVMGNSMGLTFLDTKQVATMYGCLAEIEHFKLCTNDPEKCTMEDCVCHQDPSADEQVIKTVDASGCQRCLKRCPTYGSGTTSTCGCPAGFTFGSWNSGGKTYNYCKGPPPRCPTYNSGSAGECNCPDEGYEKGSFESGGTTYHYCKEIQPTDPPTAAPESPAAGGADGKSPLCKPDVEWWCDQFAKSDCGKYFTVNGVPILQGCPTMCGFCETPTPCFDECPGTCDAWKDDACGNPLWTLGGIEWDIACPNTCGTCGK